MKAILPAGLWNGLRRLWEGLRGAKSALNRIYVRFFGPYYCPLCGNKAAGFRPLAKELMDMYIQYGCLGGRFTGELFSPGQFSCLHCGGMDRERLVAEYFLRRLGENKPGPNFRLLEFAPRPAIGAFLRKNFTLQHETSDLFMPDVDYRLDISAMPQLKEAAYDAWICLHVLEHVPDDASALRELYRILKPGGFGALLAPISLTLAATDEDPGAPEEERWRRFWQGDHVRLYAKADFAARVKAAGFTVHELGLDYFGRKCFEKLALPDTSVLYVVER